MGLETLATRLAAVAPSATVAIAERARALKAQGHDVIDLGGGDPDFATAPHVVEAAAKAMADGATHYVDGAGLPTLREAIARSLAARGVSVDPRAGMLVTPGGKAALFEAVLAYVHEGVDVLLPEPAWVSYRPMVQLAGGRVVPVPLESTTGFRLTREALESAVTPRSRLLVLNTPSNPTGRVLDARELDVVARFAEEHDLLVFADEIYAGVGYGVPFASVAARRELAARTLTFDGCSKRHAMTGFRLGWVTGPEALLKPVKIVHSHLATCVAPFVQLAGVAALNGPQTLLAEMVAAWDQRRRVVAHALERLPGVRCPLPDGAFYAFVDVRQRGVGSVALAERLLAEKHVAVTPGVAFGAAGEGHLRLALTTSDDRLREAVARFAEVLG